MKSGNLNFLEPSGPLQACNGTALPFFYFFYLHSIVTWFKVLFTSRNIMFIVMCYKIIDNSLILYYLLVIKTRQARGADYIYTLFVTNRSERLTKYTGRISRNCFLRSSYLEGQTQRFEYSVGEVHFKRSWKPGNRVYKPIRIRPIQKFLFVSTVPNHCIPTAVCTWSGQKQLPNWNQNATDGARKR
jgi:hypothetical protein